MTSRSGVIDPWHAQAMRDLLEVDVPVSDGDPLPLLWHWAQLLDHAPQSALGDDGHRRRPADEAHLRRMWAGGSVVQHRQLVIGEAAERTSFESARQVKRGSIGTFTVVSIAHEFRQHGVLAVEERQDLIYRPPTSMQVSPNPQDGVPVSETERSWRVDERFLFRYSALTYNGHRIHYDRPYAMQVEGYPGLVVHGPIQATLMAEHAAAACNPKRGRASFEYRLTSPLYDGQGLVTGVARSAIETGADDAHRTHVRDSTGRRTAEGAYVVL